ncbi:hypothetical protein SAMN05216271_0753 [Halopseudomonas sabulinigri]|uniref:Uncharacterized protein n=1 Tax=Halopseudomonas sabulinigri TaxID=472181 RepID=A0A1H1N0X5_9GAMM|nr:hypothetical protein [Halopseudomonas sabulinigri]SDR92713.1 hypothetical protein SAMN05216271_0753 [Halopseudomonas sabulinigri]
MKMLKVLLIILIAPFVLYFSLAAKSFIDGANLKADAETQHTKYVFEFENGRNVIIEDQFNKIVRSWGESPAKIVLHDNIRTAIFNDSAILKTEIDSIEPHDEYVKVKGYMGLISQDLKYLVNTEGEISSYKWKNN